MDCIFCRGGRAIELNPELPLCGPCAEMKDFMREWADTKKDHGLSPQDYAMDMIKFYNPNSGSPASASVC